MSANTTFQRVNTNGWRLGLANLLRKENRTWWSTRRWWTQALLWAAFVNGLVVFMLFIVPPMMELSSEPPFSRDEILAHGVQTFFQLSALAMSIGVIILAQGSINDERQSGTAEWVLSKPVSRAAFLLAKLVANGVGIVVLWVGVQSAIAYGLLSLKAGEPLPLLQFSAGVGGLALLLLFYLALTLLVEVFSTSRNAVLGVSLGLLLGGHLLTGIVGQLALVMPHGVTRSLPAIVLGQAVSTGEVVTPIAVTALVAIVFVVAALWKFERIEL